MEEFSVTIKPLTPIWTGDANGKNSTLRETGIIGSLRWWYEALIRGLGGYACDPTKDSTKENSKCTLDYKKFVKDRKEGKSTKEALDNQNICQACQLFGCTGWSRKFKLEILVNDGVLSPLPDIVIGTREKRKKGFGKRKVSGVVGEKKETNAITLKFIPIKDITFEEWILINNTLQLISNYGALGARTSQGNGVIKIIENDLPYKEHKMQELSNLNRKANRQNLPNLSNFFFHKYWLDFKEEISNIIEINNFWTHASSDNNFVGNTYSWKQVWNDYGVLPIAFHIRDTIRHVENERNKRHEIFGELGKGSKIFVSHGYIIDKTSVEVRIFGYDVGSLKNTIKNELQGNLKEKLFSNDNDYLKSCTLKEEKTGMGILEGLK